MPKPEEPEEVDAPTCGYCGQEVVAEGWPCADCAQAARSVKWLKECDDEDFVRERIIEVLTPATNGVKNEREPKSRRKPTDKAFGLNWLGNMGKGGSSPRIGRPGGTRI